MKNNLPPVSIFIFTYLDSEERCEILRKTCLRVLGQRYPDFEVVVSDNCSPISAQKALVSIKDPRLRIFSNDENTGFVGNVNRCLRLCTHDIIKPLCDDDLIHPDFLKLTVPFVNDETLVVADVQKFMFGTEPERLALELMPPPHTSVRENGYGADIWTLPYSSNCIPSATLFTRRLFERLGGFDKNTVTADWDFFVEACIRCRVVHVAETLCFVGVWQGSLTEEMTARPYFFQREALYTKIRVLRGRTLSYTDRRILRNHLFKEFLLQSSRVLKHPLRIAYWKGCFDYMQRFIRLMRQPLEDFCKRPR